MHHLIGLGSCLCLSLHHSISSVITHMPRRGGRPDNGRLKGPWARQRGAAVCRRGNRATSPNYPSTALGKTQWGRSLATPSPHLPPELPHSHPPHSKKKRKKFWVECVVEIRIGGFSSWMLSVYLIFLHLCEWARDVLLRVLKWEVWRVVREHLHKTPIHTLMTKFSHLDLHEEKMAQYQQGLMLVVVSCLLLGFHSKYGSSAVWLPGL